MNIIGCYSFKGGTGRSTASANIAASIAQLGKNVLLADMDIEGAGLSVVLGVEGQVHEGIQDFLQIHELEEAKQFDITRLVIDIKKWNIHQGRERWKSAAGNLYFIPAKIGVEESTIINYVTLKMTEKGTFVIKDRLLKQFDIFVEKIENMIPAIDYLVIDSASGFNDLSVLTIDRSDLLLVFFKWSRQHLMGTCNIAEFFENCVDNGTMESQDYQFVASVVPTTLTEWSREQQERLQAQLIDVVGKELFAMLPENDEMKWEEKIIIFGKKEQHKPLAERFKELGEKIVKRFE